MNNYYLKVILLEGCPYSIAAKDLLADNNIPVEIINVNSTNKNQFKTNTIATFPQIYLSKTGNNGTQLLGGYDDLSEFIRNFKGKYNENLIGDFMKKHSWSKKATLRMIQLIN
jgi:glutaredoxin